MTISDLGKILLVAGLVIAFVGLLFIFTEKFSLPWLGRLPGDFSFKGKTFSFYFPLTTSLIISIILSFILWLINRK